MFRKAMLVVLAVAFMATTVFAMDFNAGDGRKVKDFGKDITLSVLMVQNSALNKVLLLVHRLSGKTLSLTQKSFHAKASGAVSNPSKIWKTFSDISSITLLTQISLRLVVKI